MCKPWTTLLMFALVLACGDDSTGSCYPLAESAVRPDAPPPAPGDEPWCEWTVTTTPAGPPELNGPYFVYACDDLGSAACNGCAAQEMDDRLMEAGEELFSTFVPDTTSPYECTQAVEHFMRGCYMIREDEGKCCYTAGVWNKGCVHGPKG